MFPEFGQAVLVNVTQYAGSASCDLATLLQAVDFTGAICVGLALHVIIVVRLASCANEEGGGKKRSGRGTDLLDLGNVLGKGSCVDEDGLVESVIVSDESEESRAHVPYLGCLADILNCL